MTRLARFRGYRASGRISHPGLLRVGALVVGLVLVVAPAAGSLAWATTAERLDDVERRRATLETELVPLEDQAAAAAARVDELSDELDELGTRLAAASEREEAAVLAAEDARRRVEHVEAERQTAERDLVAVQDQLAEVARQAHMNGPSSVDPVIATIASIGDGAPGQLADQLHYLEQTLGSRAAAVDAAETLTVRLGALRQRAAEERATASRAADEAEEATEKVARSHAELMRVTDEASREANEHEALLERARSDRDRLNDAAESLRGQVEVEEEARDSAARASGGASRSSTQGLATVGGITVSSTIAPALERLLGGAAADGINLSGSAYRSPEVTARLRRANGCPDVYDSPASACRIPTARPGTSEHEKGLAIDFTWQGQTVCYPRSGSQCSGNRAYDWLRSNAGRFGFSNLPTEAWHWSTTGG